MSLEGFSKKGMELGNNSEGRSETRNDLKKQYISTIKRLALQKMKNYILFEQTLRATIRKFSSLGFDVSRESILKDIQNEIYFQNQSYDLNIDEILQDLPTFVDNNQQIREPKDSQSDIEQLKNNLGSIFESSPTKDPKTVDISSPIPREPAIQSSEDPTIPYIQMNEQPTLAHTNQEIHEQLKQAQEEMRQKLEWAKQQPNEPVKTFIGDLTNLSNDVKQRIIQQMESRGEVIISSIDNIYQEGNYIVVDAKDNQGRFTGTEFTLDDFKKLVNQPTTIIKTEEHFQQPTDRVIESPVQEQPKNENIQPTPEPISEQQMQTKDQIISQIMAGMNSAGEFSFGDISMGERMSIMQNVQNKLNAKSLEELQVLLSTYQEQNIQEKTMSSKMHR